MKKILSKDNAATIRCRHSYNAPWSTCLFNIQCHFSSGNTSHLDQLGLLFRMERLILKSKNKEYKSRTVVCNIMDKFICQSNRGLRLCRDNFNVYMPVVFGHVNRTQPPSIVVRVVISCRNTTVNNLENECIWHVYHRNYIGYFHFTYNGLGKALLNTCKGNDTENREKERKTPNRARRQE